MRSISGGVVEDTAEGTSSDSGTASESEDENVRSDTSASGQPKTQDDEKVNIANSNCCIKAKNPPNEISERFKPRAIMEQSRLLYEAAPYTNCVPTPFAAKQVLQTWFTSDFLFSGLFNMPSGMVQAMKECNLLSTKKRYQAFYQSETNVSYDVYKRMETLNRNKLSKAV